jgi:hypothetical protein
MRRLWWILGVVLLPQSPYSPYQAPSRRESAAGALSRANRRLEFVNRQLWLNEQNYGLNGRKNATRDASTEATVPRSYIGVQKQPVTTRNLITQPHHT